MPRTHKNQNLTDKALTNSNLTVIDFFCGAGGFSEGFRQAGFNIVLGIDHWQPAIDTFNHNFEKELTTKNILDFWESLEDIENLPNTDVIIGSPPCVSFSNSNKSGKADKSLGVRLTECFLRVVAVKKYQPKSILKAWYMENVPSSIKHLKAEYSFEDLGLGEWAEKKKLNRHQVVINLRDNQQVINSADYGSPQSRERLISGEFIKQKKLVVPNKTHSNVPSSNNLKPWKSLGIVKQFLPSPNSKESDSGFVTDPNYHSLTIEKKYLTDHFYDTGLFECEWKQSKFLKLNHPYMGKMAFPENDLKPSRTITATKIGTSREAIIYRSEYGRTGDGEFRTATVREAACIMGFPLSYQFSGGITTKWRLVGNAVCPSVARAFAMQLKRNLKLPEFPPIVQMEIKNSNFNNLNTFAEKEFLTPPRRNNGSRFRRHPFKDGNITVTLSNYKIAENEKKISKWTTSVQYGNGEGFPTFSFPDGFYKKLEPSINSIKNGNTFLKIINNGFTEKIGKSVNLQEMYETQVSKKGFLEPTLLVEEIARIIEDIISEERFEQKDLIVFEKKDAIPVKQLCALYAVNKVATIANS